MGTLRVLRHLISELRQSSPSNKVKDLQITGYILKQFRKFQITDLQVCRAQDEMKYLAYTYTNYLQSQRQYTELLSAYKGNGERSTKDTANIVGFKLPHDPK
jgi:hypothetical protein